MDENTSKQEKPQITLLEPQKVFDKYFLEMITTSVDSAVNAKSSRNRSSVQVKEKGRSSVEKLLAPTLSKTGQQEPWSYFLLKNRKHFDNNKQVPRRPFWGFKPFVGFNVSAGENSFILPSIYLAGVHVCREVITKGDPKYPWIIGPYNHKKIRYQVIDIGLWMGGDRLDMNEKFYLIFLAKAPLAFAVKELSDMEIFHPNDIRWTGQTYQTHWRAGVHSRLNSYLLDLRWFDSLNQLKSEKTQTVNAKIKLSKTQQQF